MSFYSVFYLFLLVVVGVILVVVLLVELHDGLQEAAQLTVIKAQLT